jgi:zinc transporter ZupT
VTAKNWLAVLCLVAGVPLAAHGLANGALLLALAGLALVLAAVALVGQWIAGGNKPQQPIKPAANAAWSMKDEPPPGAPRQ